MVIVKSTPSFELYDEEFEAKMAAAREKAKENLKRLITLQDSATKSARNSKLVFKDPPTGSTLVVRQGVHPDSSDPSVFVRLVSE